MGFWDGLADRGWQLPAAWFSPRVNWYGGGLREIVAEEVRGVSPAALYRTQPNLRTVVTFIARNFAQCRAHVFEVDSDGGRSRDRTSNLARLLARPNPVMTGYQLFFALRADRALHDVAYLWVVKDGDTPTGWALWRIPPSWVDPVPANAFEFAKYRVTNGTKSVDVPASEVVRFGGYSATDPRRGSPAVDALRDVLAEQIEATKYRKQVWKRGGRVSAVLTRPVDAPEWDPAARTRFQEDWYASFAGDGPRAGGTPLLEDGMTLQKVDFSASDQQWLEGVKLGFATVAQAFHVQPSMVGQTDGVSWASVREFRKMLYGETLGPDFADFEDVLNAFLVPLIDPSESRFVEFNVREKLAGDFEAEAAVISTSTGAPWMTRNEARAKYNMRPVDGGDDLVVPLNVLVGGKASPQDPKASRVDRRRKSLDRDRGGPVAVVPDAVRLRKSRDTEAWSRKYAEVLGGHLARQRATVLSRLGAKADADWWDAARWDRELTTPLVKLHVATAAASGTAAYADAGRDDLEFDSDRTLAYLKAKAKGDAQRFNDHVKRVLSDAIDDDESDDDVVDRAGAAFDSIDGDRLGITAADMAGALAAWGVAEAGRQGGAGSKTWVVTSSNPRPSHAAMDGETVGLDELFSNGLKWPGDGSSGDADELAGCTCDLWLNWEV